MKFVSTRGSDAATLDAALLRGIAADGGLYMPGELPRFTIEAFAGASSIHATAEILLAPFFAESSLRDALADIVSETYAFDIPCKPLATEQGQLAVLELFHGPTAAFKDVGAGFLAACLSRLNEGSSNPLTILVATSGDTGGAVAAAFDGRAGIRIAVLFPEGRVSARQQQQLTCWGNNVLSLSVRGAFDNCQALVKSAFADADLAAKYRLSSANSINIGRLLPQSVYYAYSSLQHHRNTGRRPSYIIPTGNLGNALACILARDMGLPIGDIVLAVNENRLIADYLSGAAWQPAASKQTLASAMDVGNPSNMERLRYLHGEAAALRGLVSACSVSDGDIERQIKRSFDEFNFCCCPHTATALHAWRQLSPENQRAADWIVVATAHAAKFDSIVEPLIGSEVPLPAELEKILSRPSNLQTIDATLPQLDAALTAFPD